VLLAGIVLGLQDAVPSLKTPAPAVKLQPERVPGLDAYACVGCHREVGEEWAGSAHGLAWVDEAYHAELQGKKRPELCYGCHAPEPLLAGELTPRPDARDSGRDLGVSCESCHAEASGAMLGPHGTETPAHPSKRSEHMSAPGSNALCSACHAFNIGPVIGIAKDFATAGLEARGLSCVGCHMAPVERAWASDAPAHTGRSHALQTPRDPAFLRNAFAVELADGGIRLVVRQRPAIAFPARSAARSCSRPSSSMRAARSSRSRPSPSTSGPISPSRERARSISRNGEECPARGLHHDPRAPDPVTFPMRPRFN
jgi:hypothetical protein